MMFFTTKYTDVPFIQLTFTPGPSVRSISTYYLLFQVKGYSQSSLGTVSVPPNLRQMYERVRLLKSIKCFCIKSIERCNIPSTRVA